MGRATTVLLAISVLFYLVAMFTAPFRTGAPAPHPWADGWQVLLTGWMGVLVGIYAWLANPLVFAAWLLTAKRYRAQAVVLAGLALLFGMSFLSQHQIAVDEAGNVGFRASRRDRLLVLAREFRRGGGWCGVVARADEDGLIDCGWAQR